MVEITQNDQYLEECEKAQRKRKIIIVSTIVGLATILGVAAIFLIRHNVVKSTERIVERAIEDYASNPDPVIISQLREDLTSKLEADLATMNTKELTEADLQRLIDEVMVEVGNTELIAQEDTLRELSSTIVKEVLKNVTEMTEQDLAEIFTKIDLLASRLDKLEAQKRLSEDDVRKLINQYALSEEDVNNLIENKYSVDYLVQLISQQLGIDPDEVYRMIAESRSYTDSVKSNLAKDIGVNTDSIKDLGAKDSDLEAQIEKLSKMTGTNKQDIIKLIAESDAITKEELQKLLALITKSNTENKEEATAIINNLDNTRTEILNLIGENKAISEKELEDLAKQLGLDKNSLLDAISNINSKLNNNVAELEKMLASKASLEEAKASILASIDADAADRDTRVQEAIGKLNSAITNSSAEDAASLIAAKEQLQAALDNGLVGVDQALADVSALLTDKVADANSRIDDLNNIITQINNAIASTNANVQTNKDAIDSLGNELQNNVDEIKSLTATKQELENAKTIIDKALSDETTNRLKYVDEAKELLEGMIKDSSDEDAENLRLAKEALEAAAKKSDDKISDELSKAKDALSLSITDADNRIGELNNAITQTNANVKTNKDAIDELGATKAEIRYTNNGTPTLTISSVIKE